MTLSELVGAAGDNAALRRTLSQIQDWMTQMETQTGIVPNTVQRGAAAVPPLAQVLVVGANGKFSVAIVNPSSVTGTLLHELKSSSVIPFSSSHDIVTHLAGVPDTSVVVDLPNATRFFQLRSRFQTSGFNSPQVVGPSSSGATSSTALTLLNTNYEIHTNPPAPIMIQPDVAAVIRVLPVILRAGSGQSLNYNGSAADLTTDDQGNPLTFDTYFVYADDLNKAGGVVTFKATLDSGVLSQNDARFTIGQITLASTGGGLLFPSDGGGGPVLGTPIAAVTGSGFAYQNVETLVAGQKLRGSDPVNPEVLQSAPIAITGVPCFRFDFSTGNYIVLSTDSELQAGGGGLVPTVIANVNDVINTDFGQQTITAKTFVGLQTVYSLTLSRNKLFLGNAVWCAN
jgi:hypothetical protein